MRKINRRGSVTLISSMFVSLVAPSLIRRGATAATDCPQVDVVAEQEALRKAEQEFTTALTSGIVENVIAHLAPDVVLLTRYTDPGNPAQPMRAQGIEVARMLNQRFLRRARNLVAEITPVNVEVAQSGDIGYVIGDFRFTFDFEPEGRVLLSGRNLHVFRKIGRVWKIAAEATIESAMQKASQPE